jgi:hypothetical protein
MRKRINPNRIKLDEVIPQINEEATTRKSKFTQLVKLTMKQEGVNYEQALKLIKQTKVATLIAIELSMLNN